MRSTPRTAPLAGDSWRAGRRRGRGRSGVDLRRGVWRGRGRGRRFGRDPRGVRGGGAGGRARRRRLEIVKYALFLEFFEEIFYGQVLESGEVQDAELKMLIGQDVYRNEQEHAAALSALVAAARRHAGAAPEDQVRLSDQRRRGEDPDTSSTFENLGAAAYLGQATGSRTAGYWSRCSRLIRGGTPRGRLNGSRATGSAVATLVGAIPDGAFGRPMTREEVLEGASPFLVGLSGLAPTAGRGQEARSCARCATGRATRHARSR